MCKVKTHNIDSNNNMNTPMTHPILYSLRNCPYAMRARLAIFKAKQTVILRDVDLKHKPKAMLKHLQKVLYLF